MENIIYKINASTKLDIFKHLNECNNLFLPALSIRVDLDDYSTKIFNFADRFEAWKENQLIGLVAIYCKNAVEQKAYITNVSILKSHHGKGVASKLMTNCILFIKNQKFKRVELEVINENIAAINLYKKLGFNNCSSANIMELILER